MSIYGNYSASTKIGTLNIGDKIASSAFSAGNGGGLGNDEDLKAYWKFSAASGDIPNSSESDETLGSGAALQVTGNGYKTGDPPVGNSMEFNGSSDLAIAGTSLSQWNFMHSTTAKWTIVFWFKAANLPAEMAFFTTGQLTTTKGFTLRTGAVSKIYLLAYNGSAQFLASFSSLGYVPDITAWHMYVVTQDQALANTNTVMRRDDNNEETMNKLAVTPVNGNASKALYVARKAESAEQYLNGYLSEVSIWEKLVSADDQTLLWNDGNGLEIY